MSSLVIAETAIGTSCRRSERLVAVTMISCSTCMSRGGVSAAVASGACSAAEERRAVNGNQTERCAAIIGFYPLQRTLRDFSESILNFLYGSIFLLVLFFARMKILHLFALGIAALAATSAAAAEEFAYDLVIRNGRLLDG